MSHDCLTVDWGGELDLRRLVILLLFLYLISYCYSLYNGCFSDPIYCFYCDMGWRGWFPTHGRSKGTQQRDNPGNSNTDGRVLLVVLVMLLCRSNEPSYRT
ncbi:unnamed protein product [Callosobruchus maculatus]|uniref:Uncharacterized protein n=1 Tax=Callosobruchus maculatus TaxID=64391 RepID=A0A653BV70_CALMS|nr:unnamed protein product [Callosobruchus maculatus]